MQQRTHDDEADRLRDEVEQLRVGLEAALEENAILMSDRDRLAHHDIDQAGASGADLPAKLPATGDGHVLSDDADVESPNGASEELRVAFEELQVMAEELEVANASLLESNRVLDARVAERTKDVEDANAALRASEVSLEAITNLVPDLLWRAGRDGQAQWYNARWRTFSGQEQAEQQGDGWIKAVHPLQRAGARAAWRDAVRSGQPFERELRLEGANGRYRWFLARAEQAAATDRNTGQWFGSLTDIYDQRTAYDALAKAERRFRSLLEGVPQLVWRASDGGKWTWSSPQWTQYTGLDEAQSHGRGWLAALHPDDRAAAEQSWAEAEPGKPYDVEQRIRQAGDKRYRHFRSRATPVRGDDGRVVEWLGTSTDVDDTLALQRQQGVLIAELQHRTRNLMGVVQAVLLRTLRSSRGLVDFGTTMMDRLAALTRVQGLLSQRGDNQHVAFDALLRAELSAHVSLDAAGQGEHIATHGPAEVPLRSATVQTFALALHELVTNAVKYGALSTPTGRLAVSWEQVEDEGRDWLRVEWLESGVADMPDPATPAQGGGYGRELIERALPYQLHARTTYAFTPDGLHCSIQVPLDRER